MSNPFLGSRPLFPDHQCPGKYVTGIKQAPVAPRWEVDPDQEGVDPTSDSADCCIVMIGDVGSVTLPFEDARKSLAHGSTAVRDKDQRVMGRHRREPGRECVHKTRRLADDIEPFCSCWIPVLPRLLTISHVDTVAMSARNIRDTRIRYLGVNPGGQADGRRLFRRTAWGAEPLLPANL